MFCITLSNIEFVTSCRDDVSMKTAGDGYVYESYYDDYTPEMENEWQGNENTGNDVSQQNYYDYNEVPQPNQQYYPQQ